MVRVRSDRTWVDIREGEGRGKWVVCVHWPRWLSVDELPGRGVVKVADAVVFLFSRSVVVDTRRVIDGL